MWRYAVGVLLIGHGLANMAGAMAPWTKSTQGFSDRPWIFSRGITLRSTVGRLFSLAWLLSTIGLVAGGVGLLTGQVWWWTAALIGALASLVAIVPWWRTVPPGARAAAVIDVILYGFLLSPVSSQIL
jgi:hypothetical protein